MRTHLLGFVDDLRSRGIPVGPAEAIGAAQALEVLTLTEREQLREGLAACLLREHNARIVFDATFELWFPLQTGRGPQTRGSEDSGDEPATEGSDPDAWRYADLAEADAEALREMVAAALGEEGFTPAEMAQLAGRLVGERGGYQALNGPAFSAYQAMREVRPQTLIAAITNNLLANSGFAVAPGTLPDENTLEFQQARRLARERIGQLGGAVERQAQVRMAELRGRERVGEYAVPLLAERINFLSATTADLARMQALVAPLARKLATRLAIRRAAKRRGAIDLRRTLRKSLSTGGVPIDLVRKPPTPHKPELVVLCDLSGSVAGFSHFTLHLVYGLGQQFSKIRIFGFVDRLDEITEFFTGTAHHTVVELIPVVLSESDVSSVNGHSNYNTVLRTMLERYPDAITRRATLLILGDARNNYAPAETELLARLAHGARHAFWLNPERKAVWGTGDSVAPEFAEIVDMYPCQNAVELTNVIAELLPIG